MNSTLYFAAFLFISGSAVIALFNIYKKWIEKQIRNKKILKIVKISANILSVLVIGLSAVMGINELNNKKEDAKYDGIFVTPTEILVPAKAGREVPIIVTNNFQYPVFMVYLKFKVVEGDFKIDIWKNFSTQPILGGGFCGEKELSCQVPGILANSSVSISLAINTKDFEEETKIEVSAISYTKQPVSNFWMDGVKELPKTIKVPKGFDPEIIYIDKKQ